MSIGRVGACAVCGAEQLWLRSWRFGEPRASLATGRFCTTAAGAGLHAAAPRLLVPFLVAPAVGVAHPPAGPRLTVAAARR